MLHKPVFLDSETLNMPNARLNLFIQNNPFKTRVSLSKSFQLPVSICTTIWKTRLPYLTSCIFCLWSSSSEGKYQTLLWGIVWSLFGLHLRSAMEGWGDGKDDHHQNPSPHHWPEKTAKATQCCLRRASHSRVGHNTSISTPPQLKLLHFNRFLQLVTRVMQRLWPPCGFCTVIL